MLYAAGGVLLLLGGVDILVWGLEWVREWGWVNRGGRTAGVVFCVGMVVLVLGKVLRAPTPSIPATCAR